MSNLCVFVFVRACSGRCLWISRTAYHHICLPLKCPWVHPLKVSPLMLFWVLAWDRFCIYVTRPGLEMDFSDGRLCLLQARAWDPEGSAQDLSCSHYHVLLDGRFQMAALDFFRKHSELMWCNAEMYSWVNNWNGLNYSGLMLCWLIDKLKM